MCFFVYSFFNSFSKCSSANATFCVVAISIMFFFSFFILSSLLLRPNVQYCSCLVSNVALTQRIVYSLHEVHTNFSQFAYYFATYSLNLFGRPLSPCLLVCALFPSLIWNHRNGKLLTNFSSSAFWCKQSIEFVAS